MQKKVVKFSVLPAMLALIFLSFSKKRNHELSRVEEVKPVKEDFVMIDKSEWFTVDTTQRITPLLQNDFWGFKAAIGFKESQGQYDVVNRFGYLGKYQFGRSTLVMIGVHDVSKFMNSPTLQEAAFYAYIARNKWVLKRQIKNFVGKTIDGVEVTTSGILAAAHLAGPGGVKRYLRSGGVSGSSDAFGTSIRHYMQEFGGYDLSAVQANQYADVALLFHSKKENNA